MSLDSYIFTFFFFYFQAEDGIRDYKVTGVQTCALPISPPAWPPPGQPSRQKAWRRPTAAPRQPVHLRQPPARPRRGQRPVLPTAACLRARPTRDQRAQRPGGVGG